MTQAEIDANSRNQVRGASKHIAEGITRTLAANERFYNGLRRVFPEIEALGKEVMETKAVTDYTPARAESILQRFAQLAGSDRTRRVTDLAAQLVREIMASPNPSNAGAMDATYQQVLGLSYQQAHGQQVAAWNKLPKNSRGAIQIPSIPLIFNPGREFERSIWSEGYRLVTSKVTLNLLPEAMQVISQALQATSPWTWQEVSVALRDRFGASQYHWTRLVRSEMAQAAHRGVIEQTRLVPEMNALWTTSKMGNTCPICLALDRKIFKTEDVPGLPHPQCRCVTVPTFKAATQ